MAEFFAKFIYPQSYSWNSLLANAADLNFAKVATLAAWLIFWVAIFLLRKKGEENLRLVEKEELAKEARKTARWIIFGHIFAYSLFWTGAGAIDTAGLETSFYPAAVIIGLLLLIIGLYFAVTGRYYLGGGWGVFNIVSPAVGIIKEGPYRYVRHPIYLGLLVIWLGASLVFFNWAGIFLFFVFLLPLICRRAKTEEIALSEMFPGEYEFYKSSTGLLLPKIL